MNYTPTLISVHDYFMNQTPLYDWDPDAPDDCIVDPWVLTLEQQNLMVGIAPIAKVKLYRTDEGKIKIRYFDHRKGQHHIRKSVMSCPSHISMMYLVLERELIVINDELSPEQILDRVEKIFTEICQRRDLKLKPNPDTDVLVHTPQGLFHSLVIY